MEIEVYFLRTSDPASSLLTDTRKALSRPGFKLIDIGEKDIGRVIEESPLPPVIVVDMFEGEVFQRIKDLKGIRIVSALLLIEVNPKSYFAIPTHPSPLESTSMYGLKIYLSGYPKHSDERRAMKKKIKRMGGELNDCLRLKTSHIVLKSWETMTAKEIRKNPDIIRDKPLMSPEWIDYCYENRNKNIGKADSEQLIARFRMKLFQNFLFSTTGFSQIECSEIKESVLAGGGSFSSSLILPHLGHNPTTHLLPKIQHGLTYQRALTDSPQTHIIELNWLRDSMRRKWPIPYLESFYSLRSS